MKTFKNTIFDDFQIEFFTGFVSTYKVRTCIKHEGNFSCEICKNLIPQKFWTIYTYLLIYTPE